jgi:hypothetical protein
MIEPQRILEACELISPPTLTKPIQRYMLLKYYGYMGTDWIAKLTGAKSHSSVLECRDLHLDVTGNRQRPPARPVIVDLHFMLELEPPSMN